MVGPALSKWFYSRQPGLGFSNWKGKYENALAHPYRKLGQDVKPQHSLKVYAEDGTLIGEYVADLLVENTLIGMALKLVLKLSCPVVCGVWDWAGFQKGLGG